VKSHALVTARLTDSGLLVSLDDAVPEKIVSINRLLPMRTRDDFIPIVALSLRRKQDNAHLIYQNSLTITNKKIAGDARCGKGLNSRSAVRFWPTKLQKTKSYKRKRSFWVASRRVIRCNALKKDGTYGEGLFLLSRLTGQEFDRGFRGFLTDFRQQPMVSDLFPLLAFQLLKD